MLHIRLSPNATFIRRANGRSLGLFKQGSALLGVGEDSIESNALFLRLLKYQDCKLCNCRSQWPRGLRRRSAAARLLRSWVRIPPGHGYLSVVSVVCCQVEVSATS